MNHCVGCHVITETSQVSVRQKEDLKMVMLLFPKCSKDLSEDLCCIARVPTAWAGAVCFTGAAQGLPASSLTSWAWLLQLCCSLPCTDLHLCPRLPLRVCNTNHGLPPVETASYWAETHSLTSTMDLNRGKTPGELSKNDGFGSSRDSSHWVWKRPRA